MFEARAIESGHSKAREVRYGRVEAGRRSGDRRGHGCPASQLEVPANRHGGHGAGGRAAGAAGPSREIDPLKNKSFGRCSLFARLVVSTLQEVTSEDGAMWGSRGAGFGLDPCVG